MPRLEGGLGPLNGLLSHGARMSATIVRRSSVRNGSEPDQAWEASGAAAAIHVHGLAGLEPDGIGIGVGEVVALAALVGREDAP